MCVCVCELVRVGSVYEHKPARGMCVRLCLWVHVCARVCLWACAFVVRCVCVCVHACVCVVWGSLHTDGWACVSAFLSVYVCVKVSTVVFWLPAKASVLRTNVFPLSSGVKEDSSHVRRQGVYSPGRHTHSQKQTPGAGGYPRFWFRSMGGESSSWPGVFRSGCETVLLVLFVFMSVFRSVC